MLMLSESLKQLNGLDTQGRNHMIELIYAAAIAQCEPDPPGQSGCIAAGINLDAPPIMEPGMKVNAWASIGSVDSFCPEIQCFAFAELELPDGSVLELTWEQACNQGCDTIAETFKVPYIVSPADADAGFACWETFIMTTDGDARRSGWCGIVDTNTINCADVNGDGQNTVEDILFVIANWGDCPGPPGCFADVNCDGAVDVEDLVQVVCIHCPPGDPCD